MLTHSLELVHYVTYLKLSPSFVCPLYLSLSLSPKSHARGEMSDLSKNTKEASFPSLLAVQLSMFSSQREREREFSGF